ncbi:hypothetical protein SISSUDRAFT_995547, partial [Sistotremastrum suecicum HHB10207 ss-3]
QVHYGQCGGIGYSGPTACVSGYTCSAIAPTYYSQVSVRVRSCLILLWGAEEFVFHSVPLEVRRTVDAWFQKGAGGC